MITIAAPAPGMFRSTLKVGDPIRGGAIVGELEILGRRVPVVAPETARGIVVELAAFNAPVSHGAILVTLDPTAIAGSAAETAATAATATGGLVFRAPTSGRFYGRPSPDKPAFVTVGAELQRGTTLCLLEVMKTFNRVTYGGADLPERTRVREVLVGEGADVNAGDPLFALEAI